MQLCGFQQQLLSLLGALLAELTTEYQPKKTQKQMLCCQLKLFKYLSFIVKVSRVAAFSCSVSCLIFVICSTNRYLVFVLFFLNRNMHITYNTSESAAPPLREVRSLLLSLETLHVITAVV